MRRAIFFGILIVFLSQCSRDKTSDEKNCSAISFKADIIPIFQTNCAISGCHTGGSPQGFVSLDSSVAYAKLSSKGYYTVGYPQYSILYQQMTSTTEPMPPTGLLNDSLVRKIYCWIKQGAENN